MLQILVIVYGFIAFISWLFLYFLWSLFFSVCGFMDCMTWSLAPFVRRLYLTARARPFSSFLLLVGRSRGLQNTWGLTLEPDNEAFVDQLLSKFPLVNFWQTNERLAGKCALCAAVLSPLPYDPEQYRLWADVHRGGTCRLNMFLCGDSSKVKWWAAPFVSSNSQFSATANT